MSETIEVRHNTVLDSEVQQAGDVYAKALFGATERTGTSAETLDELRAVVEELLPALPKFASFLDSPKIEGTEKRLTLEKAFAGRVQPLTLNFLRVLSDNGRFSAFPEIYARYRKLMQEKRGEVEVTVLTAHPLTEDLRQFVRARLSATLGKQVEVIEKVQDDLIGGMVVRVGDTVYDLSLAGQLGRVRESLLASTRTRMRESTDLFAVST